MSTRAASRLAWTLTAVGLLLVATTLLLILLGGSTPLPEGWVSWRAQAILSTGLIGAPILGGLIASRRPENPYGWLWLIFGISSALATFAQVYAAYALVAEPGSLPAPRIVGTLMAGVGWFVFVTLLPLLLLLFPTGHPPSRRWRFVVWAVVVAAVVLSTAGPFLHGVGGFAPVENPLGVGGTVGEALTVLVFAAVMVIFAAIVLSALSLVFRYRSAGGVERQQLKWFAYAGVLFAGQGISQFFYEPPGAWDALTETMPLAALYVAVGVAILRYRLYDIDVLINRTLVYGVLTATLVLVYFGGVVMLQVLFHALTGQGSQLAVVASTLAIAALFQPLRRRIQDFIDRRFYRRKYDAAKTLAAFNAKLRNETDLDRLGDELVSVVKETMQPAHASLWLRPPPGGKSEKRAEPT